MWSSPWPRCFRLATGAISILSDGLHSVTDGASNVVALVGVRLAGRPPDDDHPYGHRKFETMASVGILLFLLVALVQCSSRPSDRLPAAAAQVSIACLRGDGPYARGERRRRGLRAPRRPRLRSEVLLADARHTTSDILTSLTVIVALVGVWAGYPEADALAALVVAVFIGSRAGASSTRRRASWAIAS